MLQCCGEEPRAPGPRERPSPRDPASARAIVSLLPAQVARGDPVCLLPATPGPAGQLPDPLLLRRPHPHPSGPPEVGPCSQGLLADVLAVVLADCTRLLADGPLPVRGTAEEAYGGGLEAQVARGAERAVVATERVAEAAAAEAQRAAEAATAERAAEAVVAAERVGVVSKGQHSRKASGQQAHGMAGGTHGRAGGDARQAGGGGGSRGGPCGGGVGG